MNGVESGAKWMRGIKETSLLLKSGRKTTLFFFFKRLKVAQLAPSKGVDLLLSLTNLNLSALVPLSPDL